MATQKQEPVVVGEVRTKRISRDLEETRKQQIARRLKLSERVLEQYFESKQAEVEDELEPALAAGRTEPEAREKRV